MKTDELSGLHKALSVPVRLKILRLIAERPLCVNAVTGLLRISQPAVSQHLAVLRRVGLVRGQKSGYRVHYSLNRERMQEFRQAVAGFPEGPRSAERRPDRAAATAMPPTAIPPTPVAAKGKRESRARSLHSNP